MRISSGVSFFWRVGLLMLGFAGCGLISSDITKVSFDLPARSYRFDSMMLNIPSGNSTSIPCGDGQQITDCCMPPAPFPKPDCDATPLVCQPNANGVSVCTAHVTISQNATMNLGQEVPVLSDAASFSDLSISRISYVVSENSLNVDLPPVYIYLADAGVTDWRQATLFGTVPAIPAGQTPSGTVVLEPDAGTTFSHFAHDLSVPFNFITAATIDVPSGSPTPNGAIQLSVTGRMSVKL